MRAMIALAAVVVSGTIGVAVRSSPDGVVVSAVGEGSPARQLERRVLDSLPGSVVRVEVSRGGAVRTLDVPVEQVRTAIRV